MVYTYNETTINNLISTTYFLRNLPQRLAQNWINDSSHHVHKQKPKRNGFIISDFLVYCVI